MEYSFQSILLAFALTFFSGISTSIGSLIAFTAKTTNTKFLCTALGFSAGVMIYVSFMEIYPKAQDILVESFGEHTGTYYAVGALFLGIIVTAIIDRLIPDFENPHELSRVEDLNNIPQSSPKMMRMGLFCALALTLHNFPEGIATFTAALNDPSLGLVIAIAIAVHNVPEGIAVSIPVYHATGSKKRAFWISTISGLAEPFGALICYLFLLPFISAYPYIVGFIFALVAGIMLFISLDELLPAAEEFGEHHMAIYGLIAGMAFMAISLLLFI